MGLGGPVFLRRGRHARTVSLSRRLNSFDVTSLVVGSIIGADIYVAAAIGARLVGPASLLVWIAAGAIALIIALSFSFCATMMPRVGGPYAYVKEAYGPFSGFIVGWSMFLAEWFSLAVFPVAFAQYFIALFPSVPDSLSPILKFVCILVVFVTNTYGIKLAGRFNDALTVAKLAPLLLLIVAGLAYFGSNMSTAGSHFAPFSKGSALDFGSALVLIFWAYAGFELSTLPADEIERPERTIPRAILMGMIIVAAFYLLTNVVIIGAVDQQTLANSSSPLMDAGSSMFSSSKVLEGIVPLVIGVGALVSILGADESGTIGTSRLAFAMSVDGMFPGLFSRLHNVSGIPFVGLAVICSTAFVASILGGLSQLISASVFMLALAYLATCLSTLRLEHMLPQTASKFRGRVVVPVLGIVLSALLMVFVKPILILISVAMIAVGVPIYVFFSPRKELTELRERFLSREARLRRTFEMGERFLAWPWRRLVWAAYRLRRAPVPWTVHPPDHKKGS